MISNQTHSPTRQAGWGLGKRFQLENAVKRKSQRAASQSLFAVPSLIPVGRTALEEPKVSTVASRECLGMPALREYEYTRHGTFCLFGNFHVATGRILCPMIRQTRTELDYLENLDNLILQDPQASYRIIADNLTTHSSESLVRYVAEACEIDEPLGKKGVRGILRSVKTRVEFLTDPSHRIQFLFTPRHCSWLNQIEIWFGMLRRKVTRWMNFTSLDALEGAILTFIDYYNTTLAHP